MKEERNELRERVIELKHGILTPEERKKVDQYYSPNEIADEVKEYITFVTGQLHAFRKEFFRLNIPIELGARVSDSISRWGFSEEKQRFFEDQTDHRLSFGICI